MEKYIFPVYIYLLCLTEYRIQKPGVGCASEIVSVRREQWTPRPGLYLQQESKMNESPERNLCSGLLIRAIRKTEKTVLLFFNSSPSGLVMTWELLQNFCWKPLNADLWCWLDSLEYFPCNFEIFGNYTPPDGTCLPRGGRLFVNGVNAEVITYLWIFHVFFTSPCKLLKIIKTNKCSTFKEK